MIACKTAIDSFISFLRSFELVVEFFEIDLGFGHVEDIPGVPR